MGLVQTYSKNWGDGYESPKLETEKNRIKNSLSLLLEKEAKIIATGFSGTEEKNTVISEIIIREVDSSDYKKLMRKFQLVKKMFINKEYKKNNSIEIVYNEKTKEIRISVVPKKIAEKPHLQFKSPCDFITHHNQALDSWRVAQEKNLIGKNNILVHVDTHSDMYNSGPFEAATGIENYVNNAVGKGIVSEVYWVLPDKYDVKSTLLSTNGPLGVRSGKNIPYTIQAYVKAGQVTFFKPDNFEGVTTVNVHITKLKDLPDEHFKGKNNVLLDIDTDYFSNTGFDTIADWASNPSYPQLQNSLNTFMTAIEQKGISPAFTTVCRSPEYTGEEDRDVMMEYFKGYFPEDFIENKMGNYRYSHDIYQDRLRAEHLRKNINSIKFDNEMYKYFQDRGFEDLAEVYLQYCKGAINKETFLKTLDMFIITRGNLFS